MWLTKDKLEIILNLQTPDIVTSKHTWETVVYKIVRARLIEDKLVTWNGTSRLNGHPDIGLLDIISIQVNSVFTLPKYCRIPLKKHQRPRLRLLTQITQFSVDEFWKTIGKTVLKKLTHLLAVEKIGHWVDWIYADVLYLNGFQCMEVKIMVKVSTEVTKTKHKNYIVNIDREGRVGKHNRMPICR